VAEQSAVLAERHGEKRVNAAWIDSGTVNAIIRRELSRELSVSDIGDLNRGESSEHRKGWKQWPSRANHAT
jgi:hypothetical protein